MGTYRYSKLWVTIPSFKVLIEKSPISLGGGTEARY
jgi:hypothetical protein